MRSPTHYLSEDRYAQVDVPEEADEKAPPRWNVVGRSGRFEWHDHRTHWMSKERPPQVEDSSKRTKIFDWRIPVAVAGKPGSLQGDLFWQPSDSSGIPRGAVVALAGLVFVALGTVELTRRRRRSQAVPRRRWESW